MTIRRFFWLIGIGCILACAVLGRLVYRSSQKLDGKNGKVPFKGMFHIVVPARFHGAVIFRKTPSAPPLVPDARGDVWMRVPVTGVLLVRDIEMTPDGDNAVFEYESGARIRLIVDVRTQRNSLKASDIFEVAIGNRTSKFGSEVWYSVGTVEDFKTVRGQFGASMH